MISLEYNRFVIMFQNGEDICSELSNNTVNTIYINNNQINSTGLLNQEFDVVMTRLDDTLNIPADDWILALHQMLISE